MDSLFVIQKVQLLESVIFKKVCNRQIIASWLLSTCCCIIALCNASSKWKLWISKNVFFACVYRNMRNCHIEFVKIKLAWFVLRNKCLFYFQWCVENSLPLLLPLQIIWSHRISQLNWHIFVCLVPFAFSYQLPFFKCLVLREKLCTVCL